MGLSRGVDEYDTIERIDAFCDAVPQRRARAETIGPLVLFVATGPSWPYYARPARREQGARPSITPADIRAVRARQRELLIPESFEWIDEAAPEMTAAAPDAGLAVRAHPLMVLGTLTRPACDRSRHLVRIVAPRGTRPAPGLDGARGGVRAPRDGRRAGGRDRADKLAAQQDDSTTAMLRERLDSGQSVLAAAFDRDGPLGAGSCQALASVAEITGVGVLPNARRMGLGSAVTAALASDAQRRGVQTVFLAASDDDVARIYARIGFRRVGTAMIAEPDAT